MKEQNIEDSLNFLWSCGVIDNLCMDDDKDRYIMKNMIRWACGARGNEDPRVEFDFWANQFDLLELKRNF